MNDWLSVRKQAANRRRRVIFNNDGDDTLCYAEKATPESFLAVRSEGIQGTHVDTYAYSTLSNFTSCVHDSRVAEINRLQDPFILPHNHVRDLIDQGRDSLSLIVDFCRKNNLEVFWSARLNDMHDNWYPQFVTDYKKAHPELRLWRDGDYGRPGDGQIEPHMYATAMDFGREEIRHRQLATILDVCERYDVDGIELDFMREPAYFRPTMEGRAVEAEHLELMTGFVRQIREKADEIGQRRGKPILISARVPNLLERCRYIGLDVERWITASLLDIVIPSLEFVPFTGDITELAALAHAHGVPVYPCIGGGADGAGGVSNGVGWAGATVNALASGADGIATFNCFDPRFPAWKVLGDPSTLREADKVYAVDDIRGAMTTHTHVIDRRPLLPVTLVDGVTAEVRLPVREDLRARTGGTVLTLSVLIEGSAFGDRLELWMNGTPLQPELAISTQGCAPLAVGANTYRAGVDVAALVCGENRITIRVTTIAARPQAPLLSHLRLHVRGVAS
jgi:hypothetical protein